jgi:hypothetical protein
VTVAAVAVFLLVPYVNLRVDGQPATRPQLPRSFTPKFWRPLVDHSGPDDDEARWDTLPRRRRGKGVPAAFSLRRPKSNCRGSQSRFRRWIS